jgi:hypothetical protein
VGVQEDVGTMSRTLVLHWNGTRWSTKPSPNVGKGNNFPRSVVAIGPSNAWAVGSHTVGGIDRTLVLHWNGTGWKVQPSPNLSPEDNSLNGVDATSASTVWAVGSFQSGGEKALALHCC